MRNTSLFGTALVCLSILLHAGVGQASTAVTGVQNNGVQVRMELRTMQQQHPDMFNIYILGLRDFMNTSQTDPLSYYQIAGIHGRPYIPWDDVGTAPGDGGGYCTHTSNLFLPWHRPYLALIEQALYSHIQTVANSFPAGSSRDRYVAAAADWRLPYWDWAEEPCSICHAYPILISQEYLYLDTPTGQQWLPNPLFRYDFHPTSVSDMVYDPFAEWNNTKRYPTNWSTSAVSQDNLVSPEIVNNQISAKERLYNLFTSYSNFSQFGNEAWISSNTTNADSLESLHDVIHAITGNNGHMTYLDYSAFDPVFWLHHVMIDRCFALWQVLYPDSYVEPLAAVGATFTYPAGTINDVNSPLPPFHSDTTGTNWTSAEVTNTSTFGYTYPELVNDATQASVKSAINSLYGNSTASSKKAKNRRSTTSDVLSTNGTHYQYIANIVSQKFAMGSSYAVYLFLGNYTSNSSDWGTDENLVGIHGVFANFASNGSMAKLRARGMMDLKGTGSLPLTTFLTEKVASGQLASLDPLVVEPYLTHNLDWRASYYDGTEIPVANVIDLSVSVIQAEVQPAASADEFPTWKNYVSLVNVTADKPGGHNHLLWPSIQDGESNGGSSSVDTTTVIASASVSGQLGGSYGGGSSVETTTVVASASASIQVEKSYGGDSGVDITTVVAPASSSAPIVTLTTTVVLPLSSCSACCRNG